MAEASPAVTPAAAGTDAPIPVDNDDDAAPRADADTIAPLQVPELRDETSPQAVPAPPPSAETAPAAPYVYTGCQCPTCVYKYANPRWPPRPQTLIGSEWDVGRLQRHPSPQPPDIDEDDDLPQRLAPLALSQPPRAPLRNMDGRKDRKKKVLLMGKSGSGKSSMRSIIFSNYVAKDTRRLGATIDVEHSHVRFLGNLTLNLWDCGGQDAFMENYLATQRDHIFKSVAVLIYVFDVESRDFSRDLLTYTSVVDALAENSPDARIFCLVHKMDLVQGEMRARLFTEREGVLLQHSRGLNTACFATSIWDETLYRAWARIVYTLIPNLPQLERQLQRFAEVQEAEEVVMFERTTFLVISSARGLPDSPENPFPDRFEKISNIVKQFKQSCAKMASSFSSFELRTKRFCAYIDVLTPNTYILVVMPPNAQESAMTLANIAAARRHFERLEKEAAMGKPSGEGSSA